MFIQRGGVDTRAEAARSSLCHYINFPSRDALETVDFLDIHIHTKLGFEKSRESNSTRDCSKGIDFTRFLPKSEGSKVSDGLSIRYRQISAGAS